MLPTWLLASDKVQLQQNTIDLWLINLDPTNYSPPLPNDCDFAQDELLRASKFRFDRHRRQYLVGRGALRDILQRYTGCQAKDIRFQYGEFGKPSLLGDHGKLAFNLSNSENMALVAVTDMPAVGVDLEYQDRHLWEINSLANTVFTDQECAELNSYPADERLIPFLSGWTRKEAYLKGIGKGLALPLNDFSVQLDNQASYPKISVPEWGLFSFWATNDFICSVAYPTVENRPQIRYFQLTD